MRDIFDRPTPYTLSSTYLKPATKNSLVAHVKLKDSAFKAVPASKFLAPQITGGGRPLKRFERALRSVGALPSNMYVVPGEAARLDAYGNMSPGQIVQMLSYFRAFPEVGYRANITEKRKLSLAKGNRKRYGIAYFVGRPGGGPLGIWQREIHGLGSRIRPVMIFVSRAYYEARFDFAGVAQKIIERELPAQLNLAWAHALATQRTTGA